MCVEFDFRELSCTVRYVQRRVFCIFLECLMYRCTVYAVRHSESYTCEHILFCMVACACVSVGVPFYINNTFRRINEHTTMFKIKLTIRTVWMPLNCESWMWCKNWVALYHIQTKWCVCLFLWMDKAVQFTNTNTWNARTRTSIHSSLPLRTCCVLHLLNKTLQNTTLTHPHHRSYA